MKLRAWASVGWVIIAVRLGMMAYEHGTSGDWEQVLWLSAGVLASLRTSVERS